jgi:hypothetical protein
MSGLAIAGVTWAMPMLGVDQSAVAAIVSALIARMV